MVERSAREPSDERPPYAWVSATIMAIVVVVHALKLYALTRWPPKTGDELRALSVAFGGLSRDAVRDGAWWRALTWAFQHAAEPTLSGAGSLLHIGFNLLAAGALGIPLERRIGSLAFLQLSFVVCLGAAATVLLFSSDAAVTIGASGLVFGWAGALLFLIPRARKREFGQTLFVNALLSLMPGVSWQAHLGGFAFGLPCGLLLLRAPATFSARAPLLAGAAGLLAIWAVVGRGP